WTPFVEAVEARLKKKKGLTADLRRQLRLKLAEVYGRELGKIDEAVAAYRDLVESDPADEATIKTLDTILRSNGRRDVLGWRFELRAEQVRGEARGEILEEWATLEEEVFGDSKQAVTLLEQVVTLSPRRHPALRALSRLLMASENYEHAAEVIAQQRD